MGRLWRWLDYLGFLFLTAVYVFVLAPVLVVIVGAFNSATSFPSPFESVTLHWFAELLRHDEFIQSLQVSLVIAVTAAVLAVLVGVPAAFALVRGRLPGKSSIATLFTAPLVIPQIVVGLAMLQVINLLRVPISTLGLILVHTLFVMPYIVRAMIISLTHFDWALEEAAMSLGATRVRTRLRITLPLMRSGLVGGFVLAFIMSFVNVPLSLFLAAPNNTTLPIRVFAYMESRLDPLVAAVGALLVLAAFAVTLFMEKVLRVRLLA